MKFIIMAGGTGSKLWPISREATPKHFIPLVGKKTMFQLNVDALLERYSVYDIFVSTTDDLVHFVEEQAPMLPKENYIVEPRLNKDSGPASCYAMAKVAAKYPDEVVNFYVQSPIIRTPIDKYLDMLEGMEVLVRKYNKFVTGTQIPRYVETGSDLMKLSDRVESINGLEVYNVTEWYNVVKDRMSIEQVREISNNNKIGTHCNHGTWTPKAFFEAIEKYRPDWNQVTNELKAIFGSEDEQQKINEIYAKFEPGRIELVTSQLIEAGQYQAVVVPYKWSHITTWDDIYRYYQEVGIDTHQTDVIEIQKNGNLVLSLNKKVIALVGIENMIVIDMEDALLICPRDQANKVKEVNDILKTRGYKELL
jgi:mannose-1-phosphate guanylyltransferase